MLSALMGAIITFLNAVIVSVAVMAFIAIVVVLSIIIAGKVSRSEKMKSDKAPCVKCPHRSIACHGSCADYLAWKVFMEEQKEKCKSVGDTPWKRESAVEHAHRAGRIGRRLQ